MKTNNAHIADAPTGTPHHSDGGGVRPTIGMLFHNVPRDIRQAAWNATAAVAQAHDVNLLGLVSDQSDDFTTHARRLVDLVEARRLAGLIIWTAGVHEVEPLTSQIAAAIPVVIVEMESPALQTGVAENAPVMRSGGTRQAQVMGQLAFERLLEQMTGEYPSELPYPSVHLNLCQAEEHSSETDPASANAEAAQILRQIERLQQIQPRLMRQFDLRHCIDVLTEKLPEVGIYSCFFARYEANDSAQPSQQRMQEAHLLLAMTDQHRITVEPGEDRFASREFIPVSLLPKGRSYHIFVLDLDFQEKPLGFIWFEMYPYCAMVGDILRNTLSMTLHQAFLLRDIQEHSAEIARKQYLLDTFLENIPDSVYFKDLSSRIIQSNKAHAQQFGFTSPAQMIGKTDFDLFPEAFARTRYTQEQHIIHTGQPLLSLEEMDTGGRWNLTTKMPMRDEQGQIVGTFGISRNITRLKEIETALQRARETAEVALRKAEAANQAKTEFMANMSHELRTPLTAILGYAQILKRDEHLIPKHQEAVEIIYNSGEHLLMMINDVLDLAKIEARRFELEPHAFYLPQFLQNVTSMIRLRAENKGLVLYTEIDPTIPHYIHGDEKRLRQVMLNLLGNAVKFTENGQITFRVKVLHRDQVRLPIESDLPFSETTLNPPHVTLRFEVHDTGIGIKAEELPKLFLPFEQVGDSFHRSGGSGLGLAISRQLVRLMGGDIQVETTFGQGSQFWLDVTFPIELAMQPYSRTSRQIVGYAGEPQQILIVDDHPSNLLVLKELLTPLGFDVVEARDGQEGIEQAVNTQPNLIFLDLLMPGMDGFETARVLRKMPGIADTPIIAISASVFERNKVMGRAAGCDDFLTKPIEERSLIAILEKYLHVNWRYAERSDEQPEDLFPTTTAPPHNLIPPSLHDLKVLQNCALKGDIFGIQTYALQLSRTDKRLRPFANQIAQYAQNYQDEALLAFIEDYLTESEA